MDVFGLVCRRSGRFDDTIRLTGLDAPALSWFVCLRWLQTFSARLRLWQCVGLAI